jgi:hypothetical protein
MYLNQSISRLVAIALFCLGSLFQPTLASAQTNDWAHFWQEGGVGTRSVYLFKMDSAVTELTPAGAAMIQRAGTQSLTRELADQLLSEQYQVLRVLRVSEKANFPKMTDMTLHFDCARSRVRLARTINEQDGAPGPTRTSVDWNPVPFSWVMRASELACSPKAWRDAWNVTAKHWICARYQSRERGQITKECGDSITRASIGYACDQDRMRRLSIICLQIGEDASDARDFATEKLIPMLNGVQFPPRERPPGGIFIGVLPQLPEDQ